MKLFFLVHYPKRYPIVAIKNKTFLKTFATVSTKESKYTLFYISNNYISNARQKIKQMLSNTLRLKFYYLKIVPILHPRYHPKIIGHILKNKQKNKCVCIHNIIRSITMKMKIIINNRSHI